MTDELLDLALEDPERAESVAGRVLAREPSARDAAFAHRALGVVHRDRGDLASGVVELRSAVRWAVRSGEADLEADVRATYGVTLVIAGRPRPGLRQLDRAIAVPGRHEAVTRIRRASALTFVGRPLDAVPDLLAAVARFAESGQAAWEARALHNLGWVELAVGLVDDAAEHTERARRLFADLGLELEALWAEQNLGQVAAVRGDLPRALATYDRVAAAYTALGHVRPHLDTVRCQAHLAAGLAREAAEIAETGLIAEGVAPSDLAMLLMGAAAAWLDHGDVERALQRGQEARAAFRRLGDVPEELRARLVVVRCRQQLGRGPHTAREAAVVARELHERETDEAPVALAVAARVSSGADRDELLTLASAYRSRPGALVRASGWWARALARDDAEDRAGVLRACGRGLDSLDEYRTTWGSSELRALATGHGRELAALALRNATHDPRLLLRWSERWRATALAQPSVTPGDAPVSEALAALRDNGRRLAEARVTGEATERLERDRARLERAVRAEHHRRSGQAAQTGGVDVDALVADVGDGCLVELVDVAGELHALVVHAGRVRRWVVGPSARAVDLGELARYALRRAARGRGYAPGDLGSRLQEAVLGPAARMLPEGPVVMVPTARLHDLPWAMLPALAARPFSVTPSAGHWQRARRVAPPADHRLVLLAGPHLSTGDAEIDALAERHPTAMLLRGSTATVDAALAALDGGSLAHLAAHGHFRGESPLFSALDLSDGPLAVHDLERLRVAPHRVVLSACDSGLLAPTGAEELIGLASALFTLGTAGLVCSVAEVNDASTVDLMLDVHAHLGRGLTAAAALHAVRRDRPGEPTAIAFLALGV